MSKLVIVESPAKARTLERFLGRPYKVVASVGHVRDLPESASEVPKEIKDEEWGRMAVDVEHDFKPYYVVPADKKKNVATLKSALKDAEELLLATDPDREGESISWHIKEVLKPRIPVRRVVFHEVTEEAVREAIETARADVDEDLVRAQESRRILDRLFGYTVSPVLWKKVQTGLSAGRVQSVAVRLIVEREEERLAFRSASYWDLDAAVRAEGREFKATLVRLGDQRVATGKDFDAKGQLTKDQVRVVDEAGARRLASALGEALPWRVTKVEERPITQRPAPPFTTSTLQQEANRKLGFSSERTMQIAQRLFQGVEVGGGQMEGLISYHRTDSTTLSDKALRESARVIREMFGDEYHRGHRQYQTKVRNAQEAHEAIRPTDFRMSPQRLEHVLDRDDLRLYELIWKRTIASQMTDATLLRTSAEISAEGPDGEAAVFAASGKAIQFPGFLRAYVEGSDDPAAELGDQETLLPKMAEGDRIESATAPGARLVLAGVEPRGHETTPPPRYTEASLVKRLEEEGVGRPSTYAATVATIQRRGYVFRQGRALVPSFTAFAVTDLLRRHFTEYVRPDFTARMEELLDDISNGGKDWVDFLREFYHGGGDEGPGLVHFVERSADQVPYPVIDIGVDPETQLPIRVRIGRYGPFLQRGEGGDGHTASLPDDVAPADFTVGKAVELLNAKAAGPKALGEDPKTGETVYVMNGRYGPYVQLGETPPKPPKGTRAVKPPRASLTRGLTEETVTLDEALRLLSLPRAIGDHPDDGEPIVANFGRFGPFVKHGSEFRSLESEEQVFTITLDEAVELLRQPKQSRRRQAATRTVLAELGPHPQSGAAVKLLAGRYGPYVTDGTTNASLPKGAKPDACTLDEAVALLAARAASGTATRRGARRTGTRKTSGARKTAGARKRT
ncbi:MAG: type I DNA topoisomerase [Vicinamibacteraceae bacterium]|nr:type I DNA topoisomerase [Vicinamibacteraceae bacterium]